MTTQNKPAPTLIFIPDISGFTEFVHNTEIVHSQHIIHELLEELIAANEIDLEMAEIEGDAILFYRVGPAPSAAELLAQIQRMYTKFHMHIKKYRTQRICHCGACSNTDKLSLKFITHYGEILSSNLRDFKTLFGKDLIVAHRLMKNQIPHKEYVLITNKLLTACSTWVDLNSIAWGRSQRMEATYDFGEISYCYLTLEPLKEHIPSPTPTSYFVPNAQQKNLISERVISAPIDTVFNVLTDLDFRAQWIPNLRNSDQLNSRITQEGSTHRCLMTGAESDPFFIGHTYRFQSNVITFAESEHRMFLNVFYTLSRIGKGVTRLQRIDCFRNGILNKWIYFFRKKKKHEAWIEKALDNLRTYCESLTLESRSHPNEIVLPEFL